MRTRAGRNKGEKPPRPINDLRIVAGRSFSGAMADAAGHFMRVEREAGDGVSRHYVVHVRDPKFAVEMAPDTDAADKVGSGVLKRVSVPNSWAGNYGQYAALVKAAQEFFRQSMLAEPAAKTETRRLKF